MHALIHAHSRPRLAGDILANDDLGSRSHSASLLRTQLIDERYAEQTPSNAKREQHLNKQKAKPHTPTPEKQEIADRQECDVKNLFRSACDFY